MVVIRSNESVLCPVEAASGGAASLCFFGFPFFIRKHQRSGTKEGETEAKQRWGTQQIRTKGNYSVPWFSLPLSFWFQASELQAGGQAGGPHCANTVNNGNEFLFPPLTAFPRALGHLQGIYRGTGVYSPPCSVALEGGGREEREGGSWGMRNLTLDYRRSLPGLSRAERMQHSRVRVKPSASGRS